MLSRQILGFAILVTLVIGAVPQPAGAQQTNANALSRGACNLDALARSKSEFQRLQALSRFNPAAVSAEQLRAASSDYVARAEACYNELYGPPTQNIDDGAMIMRPDGFVEPFNTGWGPGAIGLKWGAGSPFTGGVNVPGPGIPGGTVTYSYMANGVDMSVEGTSPNVAITSLPGFQACFLTEISNAFAAWAAITNIQFAQVADSGMPFNDPGATGDIRIGAHVFDGVSSTLAHAFAPPPNGDTAAGDLHFDQSEPYACSPGPGVFDIGIIAAHEIGHAIGLNHEASPPGGNPALMNPTYNPSVATGPLGDDVNGIVSIYGILVGPPARELIFDFGAGNGISFYRWGAAFTQIHPTTPDTIAVGDLDTNAKDDLIIDFGSSGVWVLLNNSVWSQLHPSSPAGMATGDLDNNGLDEIILNFPGGGIWIYYNSTSWTQLHGLNWARIGVGNIDATAGDDLIIEFSGQGIWSFRNNTIWAQVHPAGAVGNNLGIGDIDGNGRDDVIIAFQGGGGTWAYLNNTSWSFIHGTSVTLIASGDTDGNGRDELGLRFPGAGIWILANGTTWSQLHPSTPDDFVFVDVDGNGRDDVVLDFAGGGVWTFVNSTSWVQVDPSNPEITTAGDIVP
jgi:hypothetical protein